MGSIIDKCNDIENEKFEHLKTEHREHIKAEIIAQLLRVDPLSDEFESIIYAFTHRSKIIKNKKLIDLIDAG